MASSTPSRYQNESVRTASSERPRKKAHGLILSLVLLIGSISFANATPVGAICDYGYQGSHISNGYGQENYRYSSTCDGDGFYAGKVAETSGSNHDGQPAIIRVSTNGSSWIYVGSAYNTSWRSYNVQGSQYDHLQICKGYTGICGVGYYSLILF